jgi:hypothetical protein
MNITHVGISPAEKQQNVWLHSRGMVLEDEKQRLGPYESESVAANCRRSLQLQSDVANANWEVADVSVVETVLEGERERPEGTVVLQGLQGGLAAREMVADIQPDLVRLKVKLKRSLHAGPRAAAARANTAVAQPSALQALEAKVEQLTEQLRAL